MLLARVGHSRGWRFSNNAWDGQSGQGVLPGTRGLPRGSWFEQQGGTNSRAKFRFPKYKYTHRSGKGDAGLSGVITGSSVGGITVAYYLCQASKRSGVLLPALRNWWSGLLAPWGWQAALRIWWPAFLAAWCEDGQPGQVPLPSRRAVAATWPLAARHACEPDLRTRSASCPGDLVCCFQPAETTAGLSWFLTGSSTGDSMVADYVNPTSRASAPKTGPVAAQSFHCLSLCQAYRCLPASPAELVARPSTMAPGSLHCGSGGQLILRPGRKIAGPAPHP
ncbi:uncharacterized protein [Dermacentor albipictus]|uniref:uncharacterized protein n=1 Tax=Dermacentor albipictus TaxID=60249 RepID=UPI0038FCA1BC